MPAHAAIPSPALLDANRRLYQIRAQIQAQRPVSESPLPPPLEGNDLLREVTAAPAASLASAAGTIASLPAHLGWESEALTATLRPRQREARQLGDDQEPPARPAATPVTASVTAGNPQNLSPDTSPSAPGKPPSGGWVKLYPDIALGMLRQEQVAAGRVWLLLQHLDGEGRGCLRIDLIRAKLTKTSTLRICGWRQLRNLLRQGEGIFWCRDKERVWLRSPAKVAAALGVARLTGRPVALPVHVLLQSIGDVRAHLYASFHSGRAKDTPRGAQSMPIARATLRKISGVGRRSQRAYEKRTGIKVQHNFAIGETASPEREEARAWKEGNALFYFRDRQGYQGKKNRTYLAWQLPNSYGGRHRQQPKGRQKRINRELADLFMKGMTGNGRERTIKRYYANGAQAAKAYGHSPEREVYWRARQEDVWQVMGFV